MIGKSIDKRDLEKVMHETKVARIIDEQDCRIYFPTDFINKKGPESLHWKELGYLSDQCSADIAGATGGFDMFMSSLLDYLAKKGIFTIGHHPCKGDFMVNGKAVDIDLSENYEQAGIVAEREFVPYFPRKEEDAVAFAKGFISGPAYITQLLSVQNVEWDISRGNHDSDEFYRKILEDQKKLRSVFLKRIGYKDEKFANAEY